MALMSVTLDVSKAESPVMVCRELQPSNMDLIVVTRAVFHPERLRDVN